MALLQNITVLAAEPLRRGSAALGNERNSFGPCLNNCLNKYAADNGDDSAPIAPLPPPESRQHMYAGAAVPAGYYPGYGAWFPPRTAGALSSRSALIGLGAITDADLAGGMDIDTTITGQGLVTNADILGLGLISAPLAGVGTVTADIIGVFFLTVTASINGSGSITNADLEAIGNIISTLTGLGVIVTADLAGGINMGATLAGLGSLTADITALASLIASLAGLGQITADISGAIYASATINGIGIITNADLTAIGHIVAAILGSGVVSTADLQGTAGIEATINGQGLIINAPLSGGKYISASLAGTSSLIADILGLGWLEATIHIGALPSAFDIVQAVWNSLAAAYNLPGTMGGLLNAAGAGGDPWAIALPGGYLAGSAGRIIGTNVDAKISDVKGKTDNLPADPASQSLVQAVKSKTDNLPADPATQALVQSIVTLLIAIQGAGWTNETLKAIKDAVDAIPVTSGSGPEIEL